MQTKCNEDLKVLTTWENSVSSPKLKSTSAPRLKDTL